MARAMWVLFMLSAVRAKESSKDNCPVDASVMLQMNAKDASETWPLGQIHQKEPPHHQPALHSKTKATEHHKIDHKKHAVSGAAGHEGKHHHKEDHKKDHKKHASSGAAGHEAKHHHSEHNKKDHKKHASSGAAGHEAKHHHTEHHKKDNKKHPSSGAAGHQAKHHHEKNAASGVVGHDGKHHHSEHHKKDHKKHASSGAVGHEAKHHHTEHHKKDHKEHPSSGAAGHQAKHHHEKNAASGVVGHDAKQHHKTSVGHLQIDGHGKKASHEEAIAFDAAESAEMRCTFAIHASMPSWPHDATELHARVLDDCTKGSWFSESHLCEKIAHEAHGVTSGKKSVKQLCEYFVNRRLKYDAGTLFATGPKDTTI